MALGCCHVSSPSSKRNLAVDSLGVITNVYHIHYAWLATEAPGINGFVLDLGVPILPCRIVGVHVIFTPLNGILFAKWASFAPSEGNYYHIGPSVLPVAAHHGALRVKIHMEAQLQDLLVANESSQRKLGSTKVNLRCAAVYI